MLKKFNISFCQSGVVDITKTEKRDTGRYLKNYYAKKNKK
jgi:hypothetical protein